MARTPLLRAVQKLAEEHRTADGLGISPTELRGQRDEAAYSRREILKRAGIAGAGVVAAGPLAFASRAKAATTPQGRIAIVGGGIAGLSAAMTLADKGVASTVYEASTDRVGGRMHSDRSGYWSDNQVSEFCGELIDSGHKTILHLAQRFGLATSDLFAAEPNGSTDTYWFLGGYYSTVQADKDSPIHNTSYQAKATGYLRRLRRTQTQAWRSTRCPYDWIDNHAPGKHGSAMGGSTPRTPSSTAPTKDQRPLKLPPRYWASRTSILSSDERYHRRRQRTPPGRSQTTSAARTSLRAGQRADRRTPTAR